MPGSAHRGVAGSGDLHRGGRTRCGERPRRAKRHGCPTASRRHRRPRSAGAGPVLDKGARL